MEAEFDRFMRTQPRPLGEADRDRVRQLAEQVPTLWHAATTTPADRRQIVRLLIETVTVTVVPAGKQVAVRIAWHGGAVQSQTVRRAVLAYRHMADRPQLSAEVTSLHAQRRTPAEIAEALNRAGFRPPKRAGKFQAGMVRRLLDELGLRPRVSRAVTAGVLAADERWLPDLATALGLSPHTLHGWRRKGWLHARQVGGRGGAWAVWTSPGELKRRGIGPECVFGPTPHNSFLEGTVAGPWRTGCIGYSTWSSGRTGVGSAGVTPRGPWRPCGTSPSTSSGTASTRVPPPGHAS